MMIDVCPELETASRSNNHTVLIFPVIYDEEDDEILYDLTKTIDFTFFLKKTNLGKFEMINYRIRNSKIWENMIIMIC